jgi:hypothetical protein
MYASRSAGDMAATSLSMLARASAPGVSGGGVVGRWELDELRDVQGEHQLKGMKWVLERREMEIRMGLTSASCGRL